MSSRELERIRAIQNSMSESSRPAFAENQIEHLRVLIRLTMEFSDFVRGTGPWPKFPGQPFNDLTYAIESIFSGIESFMTLTHSYGVQIGAKQTTLDWSNLTRESLVGRFLSLYEEFLTEANFERKCRLLLDLFKLQIVYAGMFYDCDR